MGRSVVPEDGILPLIGPEDQVQVAVTIQIARGRPGAVRLEHAHHAIGRMCLVVEHIGREMVAARCGRRQRHTLYNG